MYNKGIFMNAGELIMKIMEYYQVHTFSDLARKMGIGQPSISKWKSNNSINAIKKKCKELDIYDDIFSNINSTIINQGNDSRAAANDYNENSDKKLNSKLEDLTISLINKCIEKYKSEENFQFKLMNLLQDG